MGQETENFDEDADYMKFLNDSAKKGLGGNKIKLSFIPSGKFSAKTKAQLKEALMQATPPNKKHIDSVTKNTSMKKKPPVLKGKALPEDDDDCLGLPGGL